MSDLLQKSYGRQDQSIDCQGTDWLSWETISKKVISKCRIFSLNKIQAKSKDDNSQTRDFFTLDCGPWVNIIALSDEGEVIMVEQYRHGIERVTLEIPGGSVDSEDASLEAAAMRELREETGFVAKRWALLGQNHPNPALQNNFCYTFLALGISQVEEPRFDDSGTERINVRSIKLEDIDTLIKQGVISHALVITAFYFLSLKKSKN